MKTDLKRQYSALGVEVTEHDRLELPEEAIGSFDELCVLTAVGDGTATDETADYEALSLLCRLAETVNPLQRGGRKLCCHLLLQTEAVLHLLQTTDLTEEVRQRLDIYPFTMDEVWSRQIRLDYGGVTLQSDNTVHLVVFGMGQMAERVSIHAALTAHFPNFTRDQKLRTRITLVSPDAEQCAQTWIERYRQLFDNSYYRIVEPVRTGEGNVVKSLHRPDYLARGWSHFVDVEWEFVVADIGNPLLREKLRQWALPGSNQLLTIVMAHQNTARNRSEAMLLPAEVCSRPATVYIYAPDDESRLSGTPGGNTMNFRVFGMTDSGYDVRLPLVEMAKTVNYVYAQCYADNEENWTGSLRYSVEIDDDKREALWQKLSAVKRMSNLYNALSIPVKLRSVGLNTDDWSCFYDLPEADIRLLAEVEHNRWSVEELILGWRPCTSDEERAVEKDIGEKEALKKRKVHYDLRPFADLRPDATGKPVALYDLCLCSCLPLIAKGQADECGTVG